MKKIALLLCALLALNQPSWAALTSWGLDKDSYTSDFMIGSVIVSVIFPESDGSIDPNLETWSDERKGAMPQPNHGGIGLVDPSKSTFSAEFHGRDRNRRHEIRTDHATLL